MRAGKCFYEKEQYFGLVKKTSKTALTFAFGAFIISIGIPKNSSYRRRGCFEKNDSDENHIRTDLRHEITY